MELKTEVIDGKTRVVVSDEVKVFFRMNDERDYRVKLKVEGKYYYFTALNTDCPFAKVSLVLHENTNKRTVFDIVIDFDQLVNVSL